MALAHTFIVHMSKIFNFLSSSTYSSLGVNFFRFPFGFEEQRKGKQEKQSEIPEAILRMIQEAKDTIKAYLKEDRAPERKEYLYVIEFYYDQLKGYKEHKKAEETLEKLRAILENNGRNPV